MITVIAILTGVALSGRYKVLCLVPLTLAGSAAIAAFNQFSGAPFSSTVLSSLAFAAGLQVGYFAGAIVRSMFPGVLESAVSKRKRLQDQPAGIS